MSREWDLNPRPADYESAALPLSYLGIIKCVFGINKKHRQKYNYSQKVYLEALMLSKKCKYAIHALVYLAERYQQGPVHIQEIADAQHIPKKFLEAILLELRNAKVLHSKKGKGGGYYLYKKPEDVNLIEIIRLMDGAIAMLPCVSLNYYEPCEECKDEKTCGIRDSFLGVRDETLRILSESTLAKIVKRERVLSKK
jgi:Rrf2 family protein